MVLNIYEVNNAVAAPVIPFVKIKPIPREPIKMNFNSSILVIVRACFVPVNKGFVIVFEDSKKTAKAIIMSELFAAKYFEPYIKIMILSP